MATQYGFPIIIIVVVVVITTIIIIITTTTTTTITIIINVKIEAPPQEGVSVVERRTMSTRLTLDFKRYCPVQAAILTAKRPFDRALKWAIIFLEVVGKVSSDQP
jgi:hypothetical protein